MRVRHQERVFRCADLIQNEVRGRREVYNESSALRVTRSKLADELRGGVDSICDEAADFSQEPQGK